MRLSQQQHDRIGLQLSEPSEQIVDEGHEWHSPLAPTLQRELASQTGRLQQTVGLDLGQA